MIVVKVGGSLMADREKLVHLCKKVRELSLQFPLIIVPGGGSFADEARVVSEKFSLPPTTSHFMAILAMNQYGFLLHSLTEESILSEEPRAELGRATILLPYQFLRQNDILPHSWSVTSDSISAFIASYMNAERIVILKDVDGVFDSDPRSGEGRLLGEAFVEDVGGCLDDHFFHVLTTECFVLNGFYPQRLEEFLKRGKTLGTTISHKHP